MEDGEEGRSELSKEGNDTERKDRTADFRHTTNSLRKASEVKNESCKGENLFFYFITSHG